ncbi:hypothetical protein GTQ34_13645 [Muricauda sp. JGD-17]|uniref:Uncharacterized protein n=1 Tax=Flagellimonas ochracea TaxID=2696472 RepID=A0A964WYJ2_9FLAO|nr:hypothetical protein [Allomuricauda ochracea]NAY92962.1 hypothetical protein [Allomuricauda ochracea]
MAEENDSSSSGNSNGSNNSGNRGRQIPQTDPSQRSTIEKGGDQGGDSLKK